MRSAFKKAHAPPLSILPRELGFVSLHRYVVVLDLEFAVTLDWVSGGSASFWEGGERQERVEPQVVWSRTKSRRVITSGIQSVPLKGYLVHMWGRSGWDQISCRFDWSTVWMSNSAGSLSSRNPCKRMPLSSYTCYVYDFSVRRGVETVSMLAWYILCSGIMRVFLCEGCEECISEAAATTTVVKKGRTFFIPEGQTRQTCVKQLPLVRTTGSGTNQVTGYRGTACRLSWAGTHGRQYDAARVATYSFRVVSDFVVAAIAINCTTQIHSDIYSFFMWQHDDSIVSAIGSQKVFEIARSKNNRVEISHSTTQSWALHNVRLGLGFEVSIYESSTVTQWRELVIVIRGAQIEAVVFTV